MKSCRRLRELIRAAGWRRPKAQMRSRPIIALVFLAAVLSFVEAASAQRLRYAQMQGAIAACRADYFRLCPGVRPGAGRVLVCLNAQAEKLSQPCFQALAERGLAFAAALRLCRPDFERLCPGVQPGMGRGLACLLENSERVSQGCRKALSAHGFSVDDDVR